MADVNRNAERDYLNRQFAAMTVVLTEARAQKSHFVVDPNWSATERSLVSQIRRDPDSPPISMPPPLSVDNLTLAAQGFAGISGDLNPEVREAVTAYLYDQQTEIRRVVNGQSKVDKEVTNKKLKLLRSASRVSAAFGAVSALLIPGSLAVYVYNRSTQPEAVQLDNISEHASKARELLEYRPPIRQSEKFPRPENAMVEVRAALMTVGLPEEAVARLKSVQEQIPNKEILASDEPPLPDLRAQLALAQESSNKEASRLRSEVPYPWDKTLAAGLGILVSIGSVVGLSKVRENVKNLYYSRTKTRERPVSKLARAINRITYR